MARRVYTILYQYDTIDADGDGVVVFVAPSSSNEPEQVELWQQHYANLCPSPDNCKMDAFHTHDYEWGIKPGVDNIHAIDPSLQYIISETGPANWFISQNQVPEYNPAAMASAIGYLAQDSSSTMDILTMTAQRRSGQRYVPVTIVAPERIRGLDNNYL